jgi:hypothetical protein
MLLIILYNYRNTWQCYYQDMLLYFTERPYKFYKYVDFLSVTFIVHKFEVLVRRNTSCLLNFKQYFVHNL